MSIENITITPEVSMDRKILYLVRIDKEEMAFVESEREAQLVVDSIAAAESKRLESKWVKVFRQDLEDGQKVVLSTQSLGYAINGSINKACTIDYIPVGHAVLVKGRLALTASMISTPSESSAPIPVPIPAVLERLAKRKSDSEETEEKPSEEEEAKEKPEEEDESESEDSTEECDDE